MEWVEAEGENRKEAEARLLELLNATDIEKLEIEQMKVTRKFLGVGGRTVKLRGRLKEAPVAIPAVDSEPEEPREPEEPEVYESAAPAVEQKTERPEEREPEPAPVEEEKEAPAKPERVASPEGNGVSTGSTKYRPWVTEGAEAIVIPPEGRGFGAKVFKLEAAGAQEPSLEEGDIDRDLEDEGFQPIVYTDAEDSEATDEDKELAAKFIQGVLDKMGLQGSVKVFKLTDRLLAQVDSDDGGLLIGRKGNTLDSLQYLTDIVVNRNRENRVRVIVDTEMYRERRRFKVNKIALSAADRAAQTRKPVRLAPMTPSERQIVHSTLADDREVETISEGQGERRRVVVYPARGGRGGHGGHGGGGQRGGGRPPFGGKRGPRR